MTPCKPVLVLVGLGLGACTGDTLPASDAATLEIGTGINSFIELVDGAEVIFGEGAQGGYHIWVSLQTEGLVPDGLEVRLTTQPHLAQRPTQWTDVVLDMERVHETDRYQALALRLVLSYPECHIDREVRIDAEATDVAGAQATAEKIVTPRHPAAFAACPFE